MNNDLSEAFDCAAMQCVEQNGSLFLSTASFGIHSFCVAKT